MEFGYRNLADKKLSGLSSMEMSAVAYDVIDMVQINQIMALFQTFSGFQLH